MVVAVKARDENRRDTLRFVLAAVKNESILRLQQAIDSLIAEGQDEAARRVWLDANAPAALDDRAVQDVLQKQAKMRRDSIEAFEKAARADLVARERAQLAVIVEYLPAQLDAETIRSIVRRVIAETGASGPRDMGKVMPTVLAETRGRADGKAVAAIVGELLKGS